MHRIKFVTETLDRLHKALVVDAQDDCRCEYCDWEGYWDDCEVEVIRQTHQDPEERYPKCPRCGRDVSEVEE